jgi:uncharacterized membrane protein YadS
MPPFLVAFVLLAFVRTAGDALFAGTARAESWSHAVAAALTASDLLLVVGMTAVGLGVALRDLRGLGWRAIAAAVHGRRGGRRLQPHADAAWLS